MNVSLYQAAASLQAMDRWQEVIAENLASASVPGFKKQEFSFAAFQAGLLPSSVGAAPDGRAVLMAHGQAGTNFQAGEFRRTAVPTDLAIDGKGFFEVQLPDGTSGYTRDGEFHLSAQGQLVTKQGYAVLGNGGPIQIDPNNKREISVSSSGAVAQGPDLKGSIKLVDFANPRQLTRLSGSYFTNAGQPDLTPTPAPGVSLRQGWLETSNTSAPLEMANLMTAMRTFEANQRMAQIHDERIGRTISELSQVN